MLLHMPLGAEAGPSRKKRKAEQKPPRVAPGALVTATVTSVHATQAALQLESGAPVLDNNGLPSACNCLLLQWLQG